MFYYLYEIKNLINDKIYVGVHKTKSMDDGYMGSGKIIRSAIKKYGIENFTKTIIETFESSSDMFEKELETVNNDFLLRTDVYNLRRGGAGGFDYINSNPYIKAKSYNNRTLESVANISAAAKLNIVQTNIKNIIKWKNNPETKLLVFTPEFNKLMSIRAQTDSARVKRISTMNSTKFQKGENNSSYGTTWIWHELIGNKRIIKDLLPDYIDQGWIKTYKPGYRL
jgi:hypothetical protein